MRILYHSLQQGICSVWPVLQSRLSAQAAKVSKYCKWPKKFVHFSEIYFLILFFPDSDLSNSAEGCNVQRRIKRSAVLNSLSQSWALSWTRWVKAEHCPGLAKSKLSAVRDSALVRGTALSHNHFCLNHDSAMSGTGEHCVSADFYGISFYQIVAFSTVSGLLWKQKPSVLKCQSRFW